MDCEMRWEHPKKDCTTYNIDYYIINCLSSQCRGHNIG